MGEIILCSEIGEMLDLLALFYYYFNREAEDNKQERRAIDIALEVLDNKVIPENLAAFFQKCPNKQNSFIQGFCKEQRVWELPIQEFYSRLMEVSKVKTEVMSFYFEEQYTDDADVFQLIYHLKEDQRLKVSLYDFATAPDHMIQSAIFEMQDCLMLLRKYYEKKNRFMLKWTEEYGTFDIIAGKLLSMTNSVDITKYRKVNLAISWICPYLQERVFLGEKPLLLLGYEYYQIEERMDLQSIAEFGNVLSEANRVRIYDLICRKKEITTAEIVEDMGISLPNVYYHLMMMSKAGIIQSRNVGRKIIYSINYDYIDRIVKFFKID